MNETLRRALMGREMSMRERRIACVLGARDEDDFERSEEWREHIASLFAPESRERIEAVGNEIEAATPHAMATARAIIALIRSCPPTELGAINMAIKAEHDKQIADGWRLTT